jgi:serine protease DegQ
VGTTAPGTTVKIGLLREGKPMDVAVTLDNSESVSTNAETLSPALQGASLTNGALPNGDKGVKIDKVDKGTPAAQFGLQKGDVIIGVNRQRVENINALRKLLEAKPPVMALNIVRGDENIYLLLR